jgi:hypothetical protein
MKKKMVSPCLNNFDDQKKFFEFIKNHKSEIREIIKKNCFINANEKRGE